MGLISHGHELKPQPESGEIDSSCEIQKLRDALSEFELGRFLLSNLGLNGRWTSYVLAHPTHGRISRLSSDGNPMTELETWFLDRCPIVLATQERFVNFKKLTQPLLRADMRLASIPSGLMEDLLTLDFSQTRNVELTAVDLDPVSLALAEENFKRLNPPITAQFENLDAWNLNSPARWDLVTSNGLNIYIDDDQRCTEFYRSIAEALAPDGIFIISFITPVTDWLPHSAEDLVRQRMLFKEALPVKWQCMRDEKTTRDQLSQAGFEVLSIVYDSQRMFPAVLARKISI